MDPFMQSMLDMYANDEQDVSYEVPFPGHGTSAIGSFYLSHATNVLEQKSAGPPPPAWDSVLLEPGGNETQALRPGTKDPAISASLPLDPVAQYKDCRTQSDTAPPASNDAMPFILGVIDQMNQVLKEASEDESAAAEGEATPETGRCNEQPLSEDDNMSLAPGNPTGGQDSSPAPRVNNTESSDVQVRPNYGALPRAQPSQIRPPTQASFGGSQVVPHQPTPYRPTLYQPLPYQLLPYQPSPHQNLPHQNLPHQNLPHQNLYSQNLPYSTQGNPAFQFSQQATVGLPPLRPPHIEQARQEGSVNPLANSGAASGALMHTDRGTFASMASSGEPFPAPSHPQLPIRNFSENRQQASTPVNSQGSIIRENTTNRPPTTYSYHSSWAAGSGPQGLGMGYSQPIYTGFPPQSQPVFRPPNPSQLGPSAGMPQSHHMIMSHSHDRPQQYMPPIQSTTGSQTVTEYSQQMTEQQVKNMSRDLFNEYLQDSNLTEETCPPHLRKRVKAMCEDRARALQRRNQRLTGAHTNLTPQQVAGTEPAHLASDASRSVPRVTTPEAENWRNKESRMRNQSVLSVKIVLLATKIMAKQKRGRPYTGLPGVTAEDMQEFRLQYRSRPVLLWSQEMIERTDELVTANLQAMKLLGLSFAGLLQPTQPAGPAQPAQPAQSASGFQSANTAESWPPGMAQPDEDGHVPEHLLPEFMHILQVGGEQEALSFLRARKARAARESRGSGRKGRKRAKAIMGSSDESSGRPTQVVTYEDKFDPRDDDPHGGSLAFGPMASEGFIIDNVPSDFGIMEIQNARGQVMVAGSSRRRDNNNSSPALNRTIDIHIEDDLVGAAESSTPVEKFRRLMDSSPSQKIPKKKAKKDV